VPSTLRERNKAKRREAILDAALELLSGAKLSELTTEQIATRAEVSSMTVYNLVGTRGELWVALIERVVEGLVDELARRLHDGVRDPVADARMVIELSTAAFVADSAAYRQILRSAQELAVAGATMGVDPAQLQVAAVSEAQRQGILRPELNAGALGKQIYLSYIGAAYLWAGGGLDDEGFLIAALHGLYLTLVAGATEVWRPALEDELRALGARLEHTRWGIL